MKIFRSYIDAFGYKIHRMDVFMECTDQYVMENIEYGFLEITYDEFASNVYGNMWSVHYHDKSFFASSGVNLSISIINEDVSPNSPGPVLISVIFNDDIREAIWHISNIKKGKSKILVDAITVDHMELLLASIICPYSISLCPFWLYYNSASNTVEVSVETEEDAMQLRLMI